MYCAVAQFQIETVKQIALGLKPPYHYRKETAECGNLKSASGMSAKK